MNLNFKPIEADDIEALSPFFCRRPRKTVRILLPEAQQDLRQCSFGQFFVEGLLSCTICDPRWKSSSVVDGRKWCEA